MFELIIIFVSLVLTFYFSGTETAFISVNRVRIEVWRRQKRKSAEIIASFLRRPEKFIYTTLVGNNIANITFASFATLYLTNYLNEYTTWLIVTGITIVWGEIIPKTLFRSLADWLIRKVAPLLQFFYYVFLPVIWVVSWVSGLILSIFHHRENEVENFFSKRDIEILIKESHNYMNLDEQESLILSSLFNLRLLRVRDAMIPRTEIVAVDEKASLDELIKIFQNSGFTRVPVFREELDNIIGIIYLKDLFTDPQNLQEMIRPVTFVPETKYSLNLLREFRRKNTAIAIVIDEYGGTAGLVTAEDLIEELVGEIEDEFDAAQVLIRRTGQNIYSVNARIEPEQLKEELNVELPEGNYDTLAGFILNYLGHIPKREESFDYSNVRFTVTRATRRKVEWVRLQFISIQDEQKS
ncbi:MAG: hemolysin family protein [Calditrichia bacterium]